MTAEEERLDAHEIAYYAVRGIDRDPVASVAEVENRIKQYALQIAEQAVGEVMVGYAGAKQVNVKILTERILSRIKSQL